MIFRETNHHDILYERGERDIIRIVTIMNLPFLLRLRRHIITNYYVKRYYSSLLKSQFWSQDELRNLQTEKCKHIIKTAVESVPFYKHLAKEIDFSRFSLDVLGMLPVVSKEVIRNSPEKFISKHVDISRAYWSHTSGSSGKPFHFVLPLNTSDAYEEMMASRAWTMGKNYQYSLGDPVISLRSYAPKEGEPLYKVRKNIWYLSAFDLNKKNLDEYLTVIKRSQAKIIRGYASSLYIFTLLLKENNVQIPQIQSLVTSSENMLPHFRETIESFWGINVLDWYGQNERTVTVQQCSYGNYHNNDEYGYIELDNHNQIIVTSLNNDAMPFIRYATGDIAIPIPEKIICPCGRGLSIPFAGIDGRSDDILIKPDGTRVPTANIYTAMQTIEEISQFKICQNKDFSLTVTLVGNSYLDERVFNKVRLSLVPRVGNLTMRFEAVDEIIRDRKTGKIKTVESLIHKITE